MNYGFLEIISCFVKSVQNYDGCKFYCNILLECLKKKKKSTPSLKILNVSEKSHGRILEIHRVSQKKVPTSENS